MTEIIRQVLIGLCLDKFQKWYEFPWLANTGEQNAYHQAYFQLARKP